MTDEALWGPLKAQCSSKGLVNNVDRPGVTAMKH